MVGTSSSSNSSSSSSGAILETRRINDVLVGEQFGTQPPLLMPLRPCVVQCLFLPLTTCWRLGGDFGGWEYKIGSALEGERDSGSGLHGPGFPINWLCYVHCGDSNNGHEAGQSILRDRRQWKRNKKSLMHV